MGLTRVRAAVFGPREARRRAQTLHNRDNPNVEVIILPFAAGDARRRRGRGDRRILELSTAIRETFQPAILTALYPRAQIDIHVHILQADGSVLAAAINATTLALVAAGVPLRDLVVGVSGGAHGAVPLLDLTALEENDVPHTTVAVLPRAATVALVAMETRLHVDRFAELFTRAQDAAVVLAAEMRSAVRLRSERLLETLGADARVGTGEAVHDDGAGSAMAVDE